MSLPDPVSLGRLRAARDIRSVFTDSRRRAGRYVVVHVSERGDDLTPRVAVIASRRVGTAVARNRAKRLLREAARHLPWRDGLDLVLVARGSAAEARMGDVHRDLHDLAAALGLLRQVRAA